MTSVFSVVNAVLLKPFAFRNPNRLVVVREAVEDQVHKKRTAIPDNNRHLMRLKEAATTIEDAATFAQHGASVSLTGDHPGVVVTSLAVRADSRSKLVTEFVKTAGRKLNDARLRGQIAFDRIINPSR